MDPQILYRKYAPCVIGLATEGRDGLHSIGTAFHIGDGFFLTARHVIDQREVVDVVTTHYGTFSTIHSVHFPTDPNVDLAVLSTDFDLSHYMSDRVQIVGDGWPKAEAIVLGDHLDDWIGNEMVLVPIVMMGFPPVPTSREPVMLAATGEVNAVLDRYTTPHVHFVVSSPARGGFSGGPVLHAGGVLLGVVTESLQREPERGEPGFAVALSVEPIFVLLAELGIAPRANRLLCYYFSCSDEDLALFDQLLNDEERTTFDRWKDTLKEEDVPPSLGVPSQPIIHGAPIWEAPDDRYPRPPSASSGEAH